MNEQINFADIFKNNFLETVTPNLNLLNIGATLMITFLIGLFLYSVYKKTFKGILYSKSFNVSLVMISMITSLIIMAISSNVILSLGMVGALSIVRFRTAIKDPIDLIFMFWAISVGIVTGAGLYQLAILGSLIIGLTMTVFTRVSSFENPFLLVLNCENDEVEQALMESLSKIMKKYQLKSKTVSKDQIEVTIEIRLKKQQTDFVNELSKMAGVRSAVLVSYDGDYVS